MADDWRTDEAHRALLLKVLSLGKLAPKLDPEMGITYPDADEVTGSREATGTAIKSLVSQGALVPEVHDRVAACPKCGSPRVVVRERCPYCVKPDTIIAGEYKPISQLSKGDVVFGVSGEAAVAKVFSHHYDGPLVRIKPHGMLPLELTPEHNVLVVTGEWVSEGKRLLKLTPPYWKPAAEADIAPLSYTAKALKKPRGDFLVLPRIRGNLSVSELDLRPFTNEVGVRAAKAKGVPLTFPLNSETAWLLGLYVAEGSVQPKGVTISLGRHGKFLERRVIRVARSLGYSPRAIERATACRVEIPSRILARAFATWCGKRAHQKRVPEFILRHESDEVVKAFLMGYFNGDNFPRIASLRGLRKGATTVSMVLALQLQLLLARFGIFAPLRQVKGGRSTVNGRTISGKGRFILSYPVERKRFKKKVIVTETYILVPICSVEKIHYSGPVYNIQTSDDTYVASNIVVHNCGSQLIRRKEMVQHVRYGHSAVVDATGEETVRCPVCGEDMSVGEFRVAGSWFRCDICHENFDKPEVSYGCLIDGTEFTYRDARLVDVQAYRLSPAVEAELRKSTEVVAPVAEILKARGFDVRTPGEVVGTSGVKHEFDIVASSGAERIGVEVVRSASPVPAERVIPTIVKMLDAGLTYVILVAMPSLDAEAKSLLSTYEVKLVEGATPAEVTNALVKMLFPVEEA